MPRNSRWVGTWWDRRSVKARWERPRPSRNLGHHQPVSRRLRGVEERIVGPNVEHVIDTKMRVFEQVRGLLVDLKRIVFVERVEIEALSHPASV